MYFALSFFVSFPQKRALSILISGWTIYTVAQLVEHRAAMREVVSSTSAGPTLRVLKKGGRVAVGTPDCWWSTSVFSLLMVKPHCLQALLRRFMRIWTDSRLFCFSQSQHHCVQELADCCSFGQCVGAWGWRGRYLLGVWCRCHHQVVGSW